jgi:hypothetical protein
MENAYRILYIEFKNHGDKAQTPKLLQCNSLISMYIIYDDVFSFYVFRTNSDISNTDQCAPSCTLSVC